MFRWIKVAALASALSGCATTAPVFLDRAPDGPVKFVEIDMIDFSSVYPIPISPNGLENFETRKRCRISPSNKARSEFIKSVGKLLAKPYLASTHGDVRGSVEVKYSSGRTDKFYFERPSDSTMQAFTFDEKQSVDVNPKDIRKFKDVVTENALCE